MKHTRFYAVVLFLLLLGSVQAGEARGETTKPATAEETTAEDKAPAKAPSASSRAPTDKKTGPAAEKPPNAFKIRAWVRLLDNKDEVKRRVAKDSLLANPKPSAKEIRGYIKGYPVSRRLAAVSLLEAICNKDAKCTLASRAIFDKNKEVRLAAAKAVRGMGGKTAVSYIITRAFDENESTRRKVARAVANINDKGYMDHLIRATAQVAAYASARVDTRAERTGIQKMGKTRLQGDVTDLAIDLPTTTHYRTGTVFWTLCMVAGRNLGTEIPAWQAWWKKDRETFTFPNLEKEDDD